MNPYLIGAGIGAVVALALIAAWCSVARKGGTFTFTLISWKRTVPVPAPEPVAPAAVQQPAADLWRAS